MPKRVLRNLKLSAIAAVDSPCQEGAKALIMKRRDPSAAAEHVAKYICEDSGAHSFSEVLRESKFSQEIWPCVDALSQSIRSIVGDSSLTGATREEKINSSVGEFLAAVREISPEVSKQLAELVRKKEVPMPKTVEELEAELATAKAATIAAEKVRDDAIVERDAAVTAKNTAESERDAAKAGGDSAKLAADLEAEKSAHAETKKQLVAATDETIKVDETEVKKSEVGDAQFKVTKALVGQRDLAVLEKRATTELAHVIGTPTEKAQALQHVEKLDKDSPARKSLEAIISSAEKMARAGFETLGTRGDLSETTKAAKAQFEAKVTEIEKRDSIPHYQAMSKARQEHPELFAAYNGEGEEAPTV